MTWGPEAGGEGPPPPPPPAPEEQPTPGWAAGPPGRGGPPRGPSRTAAFAAVAIALAVSLAANVVLALRVRDETDQQARLRGQVSELQREVEALQRQQGQTPSTAGSLLDQVAAAVEKIRGLKFKKHVDPELLTDQQLRARVEEQFRKDNPRADIDQSDKVLTTLGMLSPADDLFDILLGVQTEQVAGFYDSVTKKLVVGGNATHPSPLDRVLLAHEYVHAVTDQLYDLSRIDKLQDEHKDDEAFAFVSLAEGDATVMMLKYSQQYLTPDEQREVVTESSAVPMDKLEKAPPFLKESLLFPYQQGVEFVRAVVSADGTDGLNKAYQNPPTSTEQILHPAKYTGKRDDPTTVKLPGLSQTLGAGWTDMTGGGIGELDVRLIVDQFLSSNDAEKAAEGWDGGGYAAAESSSGVVVAISTVWDSQSEAREATDVLSRWLPTRYGNNGSDFRPSGAVGRGWKSSGGAGEVVRSASKMLLILGPDQATVEKARSAFGEF